MAGVEILNEYAVNATPGWVAAILISSFCGAILFGIITMSSAEDVLVTIGSILTILCMLTALTFGMIESLTDWLKEYSHTEYKVTIDDSVSMNEFLDKYEIIDQEGKIYTVKEKEQ